MSKTELVVEPLPKPTLYPKRGRAAETLHSLGHSRTGLLGLLIVLIVAVCAIVSPYIAPHDPIAIDIVERLKPPFWLSGSRENLLGTDPLGRDILSCLIYGSRISLLVGTTSVALGGAIGVLLGLVAGYYGGRMDAIIMRLVDIQLAVPSLVLALAVIAVLGASLQNLIFVLSITCWVTYARIVRGETLSVREEEFVVASRALGSKDLRIIFLHVLPNVSSSIIVVATLQVAQMILAEAGLSFLGLGVRPPTPTWGSIVADGRDYLSTAWWISTFSGLTIFLTVLGINLFGDWVRDRLDPTLRI